MLIYDFYFIRPNFKEEKLNLKIPEIIQNINTRPLEYS